VNTQVKARQAATVILLRASEPKGFEVFLTQRPDSMPFLGGKYCYPGGSVIKEDCSPPATARCTGLSPDQARKIVGAHFSPRQALGFWIAAIRELFEEVGILLAMHDSGERFPTGAQTRKMSAMHDALLNDSLSFTSLLES